MIHPDTRMAFVSPEIGYGVCASRRIPKGTIVWAQDPLDIILPPTAVAHLPDMIRTTVEHYAFVHSSGDFILCWDAGRFINHSCEPTTVSVGNFCTIAACDIQPGQQLTEDYATLNIMQPLNCLCGSVRCRSNIYAQHLAWLSQEMDIRATEAITEFLHVEQKLLPLLSPEQQAVVYDAAQGKRPPPTCFDNALIRDVC